jgi:predicted nucleotidyltransferase
MQQNKVIANRVVPNLQEVVGTVCAFETELRAAGVIHAAIFGSVARGDAVVGSDIDVLVELDPAAHVSLFELAGIERRLAEILGRKVDVVSKRGLRPGLDDSILADAVVAF